MKALFWCAQLLLTSSVALLTHASKVDGGYAYNTYSVPFFSELLKVCISAILLAVDQKRKPKEAIDWTWHMILVSSVPAVAYFVSNNINFLVVQYLGPSTFQLLSSLKIVSTAFFFRAIIGVQLSGTKWKMLILVSLGCAVSQLGCSNKSLTDSSIGYILKFVNILTTGLASVYNEKVLKSSQTTSVHLQNLVLYLWGVLFAVCSLFISSPSVFGNPKEILKGYSSITFCIVVNYALVGLATSFVLKYLDNIAKTFAAAASMFLVAIFSYIFFAETLTASLFIGMLIVVISCEVYYRE